MKVSPTTLQLRQVETLERTFSHWTDHQFTCSCGHKFNGSAPERDPNAIEPCPLATEETASEHVVTLNPPQTSFTMKFKRLGQMDAIAVQSFLNEMAETYIYGKGEKGKPGYVKPIMPPPIDGKVVPVSETACQVASILCKAQYGVEDADKYTFIEWLWWMMSDTMCEQMIRTSIDVQPGVDAPDPLATAQKATD
jgi:hypothetical protein